MQSRTTNMARRRKSGRPGWHWLAPVGVAAMVAACGAPQHPILYPNSHFKDVGVEVSQTDITGCREMAEAAGATPEGAKSDKVANSTAKGAAIGSVGGAVAGAIAGRPGRGILVGAAGGATAGLVRELAKSSKPSEAYKLFVNRCLEDQGYEVIGWE